MVAFGISDSTILKKLSPYKGGGRWRKTFRISSWFSIHFGKFP